MLLMSFSKAELTIMIQICHRYSLKWLFGSQAGKCSVVVYNESEKEFRKCKRKRQWFLGTDIVKEATEYKHLGVILDMSLAVNVDESFSKLKTTLLILVVLMKPGFILLSHFIYISQLFYQRACMVLNSGALCLRGQEEKLERAHRFCVKFIQVLPKQTRTDIALGLLGSNPIIAEIHKKKLIFLGQLCRLPPEVIL